MLTSSYQLACVILLNSDGRVSLSADGIVKLSKSERAKKCSDDKEFSAKKKSKEKKKKRKADDEREDEKKSKKQSRQGDASNDSGNKEDNDNQVNENEDDHNNDAKEDAADKNKPCKGNPSGITRLFLGNLPFAITDSTLNDHLNSTVTHIKW
jgi:RNA recognition motif-containing protein